MLGCWTAVQIASASFVSFFCRRTNGFTYCGAMIFTEWPCFSNCRCQKKALVQASIPMTHGSRSPMIFMSRSRLTIVDTFSRFAPAVEPPRLRFRGADVVETLERVGRMYGLPKVIRVDQGSEFASRELDLWAYTRGVTLDVSRPGNPWMTVRTMRFLSRASAVGASQTDLRVVSDTGRAASAGSAASWVAIFARLTASSVLSCIAAMLSQGAEGVRYSFDVDLAKG
jgi:hypothetical protein